MVYESRVGDTFLLGTSSWRIEDITARPGDRGAGAGRAGADAVLEGRRPRQAAGAGPGAGQVPAGAVGHARAGRAGPGHRGRAGRAGGRQPASPTWPSRRRPPGTSPTTGRCSSSGSATSSATGGWSCTRRSGRRSTRRGRWRSAPGCGSGAGSRRGWRTPTTASSSSCRTRWTSTARRSAPPRRTCCSTRRRWSRSWSRRWAARRCSPPGSASAPRASLLLPRRDPRKRTPLWRQRQRSAQLLSVAAKYEQFPVVLEAMRECLQDVYDVAGLREADDRRAVAADAGGRGGDTVRVAVRTQHDVRLRGDVPLRRRRSRWPSGGPPRCRWTARCSRSCSARRRSASCSTPTWWPRWSARCSGWTPTARRGTRRTPPTCSGSWATCPRTRPRGAGCARSGSTSWSASAG